MNTKELRTFARSMVYASIKEREAGKAFDRGLWRAMADTGIVGMALERRCGGGGAGMSEFAQCAALLAGEGLDLGLALSLVDHVALCAYPLQVFGSERLKERYLPYLCNGDYIGAAAVSEAEGGGDPGRMKSTASRSGDHYSLQGVKGPVTNAPVADVFLVVASTDLEAGKEGLSAFLVERSAGVRVEEIDLGYLPTAPHGRVVLDGVKVSGDHLLGEEGWGHERISRSLFIWERTILIPVIVSYLERWHHLVVSTIDPGAISPDLRTALAQRKVELTAYRALGYRLLELSFGEAENGRERMELLLFFGKALPEWVEGMRAAVEEARVPMDGVMRMVERDLCLLEVGRSLLDWQFQKLLF